MEATDGSEVEHDKKSDYNTLWNLLDGSGVRMMGDHENVGGTFELRDNNQILVGQVSFDKNDAFLAAKWYGQVIVSGRAMSQRLAMNVFVQEVEKTHG